MADVYDDPAAPRLYTLAQWVELEGQAARHERRAQAAEAEVARLNSAAGVGAAFYRLTVLQRDAAWREVEKLEVENRSLRALERDAYEQRDRWEVAAGDQQKRHQVCVAEVRQMRELAHGYQAQAHRKEDEVARLAEENERLRALVRLMREAGVEYTPAWTAPSGRTFPPSIRGDDPHGNTIVTPEQEALLLACLNSEEPERG